MIGNSVEHGSTGSRPQADDAVEHGSTSPASQAPDDTDGTGSTTPASTESDPVAAPTEELLRGGPADPSVTVRVGTLDDESGFYLADDGPGIPDARRDAVFESGFSTSEDGTGFGLSIVEQVADAHGWSVRITESEFGDGTDEREAAEDRESDSTPGARFEITGVDVTD
ncbi:hypothetical protein BRD06_09920 [Halobacteriales archaeon QS_9_67_15]|nr:MAG: hypothetical protein BRD06_09920 [Halobacteriales archaeon QS_9_67_15]